MSTLSVTAPYPAFAGTDGLPLDNGYIWIGVANLSPQVNPIPVYWDEALTIPAVQPIRTSGGYLVYQGTPARLYVESDYSIQVLDSKGSVIYTLEEASIVGPGAFTTLSATTGNITTVNATTGNITTVNATTGNITTVNATTGNITTVNATTITATGTVTAETLTFEGGGSITKPFEASIQPITATVAANALTVTLNPTTLDFRSATLGSGTVSSINLASAASVIVPATATLGTVSAVQGTIVVVAINNAGTI